MSEGCGDIEGSAAGGILPSATFRELLAFAAPYKTAISVALVLGILGSLASLAQPLAVGGVLEAVRTGGSVAGPAVLLAALFVVDGLLSGFQAYLMSRTGEAAIYDVRRTLVGRLLRMTVAEHDRRRAGDLLSRVGTDTMLLKSSLTQSLTNILVGALIFVGALAFMAAIDPLLLVVALVCVMTGAGIVLLIASGVRRATEEAQESLGSMSAALERALRAVRTVKVSRGEEREEREIWEPYPVGLVAGLGPLVLDGPVRFRTQLVGGAERPVRVPEELAGQEPLLLDGFQDAVRDYRGYALHELQEQGAVVGGEKKVEGSERQYGADEFQRFLRVWDWREK